MTVIYSDEIIMQEKASKSQTQELKLKLHNVERMYILQKETNKNLREWKKESQEREAKFEVALKQKDAEIEKLKMQLEEFRKMIFKKKKKWSEEDINLNLTKEKPKKNRSRTKDSYKRELPHEISETKTYHTDCCPDCWNKLWKEQRKIRYVEDIQLPAVEETQKKVVVKELIYEWYCRKCHKRVSDHKVAMAIVSLWEKVKIFVAYCIVALRLSYQQTKDLLVNLHGIRISDGEISKVLENHAEKCNWKQEEIRENIGKQKWVHLDETSWPVQEEEIWNYCWIMKWTETEEAVYILGENRGWWNVQQIRKGPWKWLKINKEQVGISDNYNAYKNVFKYHQLCWAHPYRKFRDLVESGVLGYEKKDICRKVYEKFWKLYEKVRKEVAQPFDKKSRKEKLKEFEQEFSDMVKIEGNEPEKLLKIKESLRRDKDKYFTCMLHEGIPLDNNAAERWLRHLVLKRKNSFWSKTKKWAQALSVLNTVILSLRKQDPENFFKSYQQVLNH